MANKFLKLIESTIQRMTNGGVLVGDRVVLAKGYKSKDSYKKLNDRVKDFIETLFNSNDLNKKVINIKTEYPSNAPGNIENRGIFYYCDVAPELANGLYDNQNAVTIPSDCLEVVEDYINRSSVPNSQRYDNKVKINPELPEENEEQQQVMTQQGNSMKRSQLSYVTQNVKIPSMPATPSPVVGESYTSMYVDTLKEETLRV